MEVIKLVLVILCLFPILALAEPVGNFSVARPWCTDKCGKVRIPFPFGIGRGCFFDEWYEVVCNENNGSAIPRLNKVGLEVLNITVPTLGLPTLGSYDRVDGLIRVNLPITYSTTPSSTDSGSEPAKSTSLIKSNFFFSQDRNLFVAVGCNNVAFMNNTYSAIVGCQLICRPGTNSSRFSMCSGQGCCQNTIPSNLQAFNINFQKVVADGSNTTAADNSSYGFLVDRSWFVPNDTNFYAVKTNGYVPVLLEWGISNGSTIGIDFFTYSSKAAFYCTSYSLSPYRYDRLSYIQCFCNSGYYGNPYLVDGCHDIDECEDPDILKRCRGKCVNRIGGFSCVDSRRTVKLVLICIGGVVGGFLLLLVGMWMQKAIKRRKQLKMKQKFFKQNGGLLLQQQLSSPEGNSEKSKVFNSKEMEKATDNFNENRILGQGGQGTVYKGMLVDGRIVAIKKSKVLDVGNVEQFINEVFILSQINHRNVVRILGCCLETEVPLLVYEFIPNGTLYQYLHNPNEEFPVSWEVRLRLATEIAGALSYLHSAASIPIYHRDIKTTNILLDEKYRAKIADFGTSRSVALDQTHVTTLVQGTFGYLDPEYFQSSQFTDKSDVYSFGVVLVELLTGQKPISSLRANEGRSLATYFILSMEEDHLFDIVDTQVLNQGKKEEIVTVANLAKRCLNLNGRKRPTMKEVAMKLEGVVKRRQHLSDHHHDSNGESAKVEAIEAHEIAFRSQGSKVDDDLTTMSDVFPLLSTDTW